MELRRKRGPVDHSVSTFVPPPLFFLLPPPPLTQQGKCWISGGGVYMLSTPTLRSSAGPHMKYKMQKYNFYMSQYQLKHSCTHAFTCSNRRLHVIISNSSRRTHVIKFRRPILGSLCAQKRLQSEEGIQRERSRLKSIVPSTKPTPWTDIIKLSTAPRTVH